MDLQLNATRRSFNDSVYLVFDLKAIENELLILDSSLTTCGNNQCKTHQLAQIRHFELPKFCNEQIV